MKTLVLSFSLSTENTDLTIDTLIDTLKQFGVLSNVIGGEFRHASNDPSVSYKDLWIYVSPDDEEPYLLVENCGAHDGKEIKEDDLEKLRQHGMAVGLYCEHPRIDKYGAPLQLINDDFAATYVDEHGFAIDLVALQVSIDDTGDDSSECNWIKLRVPVDIADSL